MSLLHLQTSFDFAFHSATTAVNTEPPPPVTAAIPQELPRRSTRSPVLCARTRCGVQRTHTFLTWTALRCEEFPPQFQVTMILIIVLICSYTNSSDPLWQLNTTVTHGTNTHTHTPHCSYSHIKLRRARNYSHVAEEKKQQLLWGKTSEAPLPWGYFGKTRPLFALEGS